MTNIIPYLILNSAIANAAIYSPRKLLKFKVRLSCDKLLYE